MTGAFLDGDATLGAAATDGAEVVGTRAAGDAAAKAAPGAGAATSCCWPPDGFVTITMGLPHLVWMILWPPTIMGLLVTMAFPGEPGVRCTTITDGRVGVPGRST